MPCFGSRAIPRSHVASALSPDWAREKTIFFFIDSLVARPKYWRRNVRFASLCCCPSQKTMFSLSFSEPPAPCR